MKVILSIVGLALVLGALPAPGRAEWRIEPVADASAKNPQKAASLESRNDDRGIRAKLVISCRSTAAEAHLVSVVELSAPLLFPGGFVDARYRTDDGKIRRGAIAQEGNFSRTIRLSKLEPVELQAAKRLEVRFNLAAAPMQVFAFDLAGADRAIAAIPCRRAI